MYACNQQREGVLLLLHICANGPGVATVADLFRFAP